jgi:hypothetical protein
MSGSIIKDFRELAGDILVSVKDLLRLTNTRSVNDFNKAARQNELTTYSLVSENVSAEIYKRLSAGLEAQLLANIESIVNNAVLADPTKAVDFVKHNFTNNGDMTDKIRSAVTDISDHLSETVAISDLSISFNNSLKEASVIIGGKDSHDSALVNRMYTGKIDTLNKAVKQTTKKFDARKSLGDLSKKEYNKNIKDLKREEQNERDAANTTVNRFEINKDALDKQAIQLPGHFHTISIKFTGGPDAKINRLEMTVFIRTQIIAVEASKIIEAIGSAKGRSMFNSYLEWRAGSNGFFKGFLMNLKEVQKQVDRDTSKDMTDRILGSLLTKGGFTRPKMLGEITEFKNYNLVLSTDDADRLFREQGLNLSRAADLKKVFNGLNILALVIVDEVKGRAIFYESSDPANMAIISFKSLAEAEKLTALFSTINRG